MNLFVLQLQQQERQQEEQQLQLYPQQLLVKLL